MSHYSLPQILDTAAAASLQVEILGRLEQRAALGLDGSAVGKVGLACLQLIVAARGAAIDRGLGFSLTNPSQPLCDMAALAGLNVIFDSVD